VTVSAGARVPPPAADHWSDEEPSDVEKNDFFRRRREKRRAMSRSTVLSAERDVEGMIRIESFAGATGKHFVALCAMLHGKVYGVADEVGPRERMDAAAAAARMLRSQFDGDADAMADFVRWAWLREKDREEWRRENGRPGGRLGWRLLFSGAILTDYRLDKARRGAKEKTR